MNPGPPFDQIAAFLAVMRAGSLSAAARALGLTQPTVRRQIEALEGGVAQPLFTRTTAGLMPTDAARNLLPLAETVAASGAAFLRAASSGQTATQGVVRITAPRVISVETLPRVLAPLIARAPGLRIELAATNRIEDLSRQDADIALRVVQPAQAALVAKRLRPIGIGLFAHPDLVARMPTPATLADTLGAYPMVTEDRARALADGLSALSLPYPGNIVLRTDDELALLAAIRAGIGAGFCQTGIARRDGLIQLFPQTDITLPLWAVVHEDLRGSRPVRAVFDHLVAVLG